MILTPKQQKFVNAYCETLNGAKAARAAGYSELRANRAAYELLNNPEVKAAIDAIFNEQSMSTGEAIRRLTDMGRATVTPFIQVRPLMTIVPLKKAEGDDDDDEDDDEGFQPEFPLNAVIDLTTEEAKQYYHLIKKMKQGKYGIELELHDAKDAIVKLLEIQGKLKQPGTGDTTITIFELPDNGR